MKSILLLLFVGAVSVNAQLLYFTNRVERQTNFAVVSNPKNVTIDGKTRAMQDVAEQIVERTTTLFVELVSLKTNLVEVTATPVEVKPLLSAQPAPPPLEPKRVSPEVERLNAAKRKLQGTNGPKP